MLIYFRHHRNPKLGRGTLKSYREKRSTDGKEKGEGKGWNQHQLGEVPALFGVSCGGARGERTTFAKNLLRKTERTDSEQADVKSVVRDRTLGEKGRHSVQRSGKV